MFLNTHHPGRIARSYALVALALGIGNVGSSQCNSDIDLGPDTILCEGQNFLLNAGAGYESYLWNNGSTSQIQMVNATGMYSCTVTDFGTSGELVTNGNFSAGTTGFTSEYALGAGGPWGMVSLPGTYGVGTNAQNLHSNFSPCADHTGGGNMLVVNGAEVAGQSIWCETVAVQANTEYAFSAWLCTVFSESPAQLEFTINGVPIGSGLNASIQTCNWLNFYEVWSSAAATSATICISNLNTSQSGNDFALDDISFAPFCTYTDEINVTIQPYPGPDLGVDVEACEGDAVMLDATMPGADGYSWQDGSSSATFPPTSSGTYWVDVTINGCTGRDSLDVALFAQPAVELGPAQQRCAGEVVVLDVSTPGATYLWQDGSTGPTFEVSAAGNYSVAVELGVCAATDNVTFIYHPLPVVDLGSDTTLCADTALVFDVYRPGATYLWQDGTTSAEMTTSDAGTYSVVITENGCTSEGSMELGIIELPFVDLGPDRILCIGFPEVVDAFGPGYSYVWNDGGTDPRITINGPGEYGVIVRNECGSASDSITVVQDFCDCPVFVPNAYTPGDDGINDGFRPRFDCPTSAYRLSIFNRWGELFWESTDPYTAWKADSNIPLGIYAWTLEIRPEALGTTGMRRLSGHVLLLR